MTVWNFSLKVSLIPIQISFLSPLTPRKILAKYLTLHPVILHPGRLSDKVSTYIYLHSAPEWRENIRNSDGSEFQSYPTKRKCRYISKSCSAAPRKNKPE